MMLRSAALALAVSLSAAAMETLAVRTLALRGGEMPELHLLGGKEHIAIEFSEVQPGPLMRVPAANPLPLYRSETKAGGGQAWVVARKIPVPAGAKGILLLAVPDGDNTRITAIKDEFGSARYNDWLLINVSSKPVAFAVGDKARPVLIASGTSATHRVSAPRGQGTTVLAQAPIDGKPTVFYSTYWPVREDRRSVVLFADDGPSILVKRIADTLAPLASGESGR